MFGIWSRQVQHFVCQSTCSLNVLENFRLAARLCSLKFGFRASWVFQELTRRLELVVSAVVLYPGIVPADGSCRFRRSSPPDACSKEHVYGRLTVRCHDFWQFSIRSLACTLGCKLTPNKPEGKEVSTKEEKPFHDHLQLSVQDSAKQKSKVHGLV